MPRKLKTFSTSGGFFDLAVAAPSMKAALQAWGAESNLFKQGFARETDDPAVVAATMARPGVVLRRPVGTKGAYSENAELAGDFSIRARPIRKAPAPKPVENRKAGLIAARELERSARRQRKEEAALQKARKSRESAVVAAKAALDAAEAAHEGTARALAKAQANIDRRVAAEDRRWAKQKEKLNETLRRARSR